MLNLPAIEYLVELLCMYSPFEVVYGVIPYMPVDFITLSIDKFIHGNTKEHLEFMLKIHKEVRKLIEKTNEEYKK